MVISDSRQTAINQFMSSEKKKLYNSISKIKKALEKPYIFTWGIISNVHKLTKIFGTAIK